MSCIDVLYIAVFWVLVIDISGFIDEVKYRIFKWLNGGQYRDYSLKPFDCSLCMTWWTCFIIILFNWNFHMLVYSLMVACFTPVIKDIILMVRDMLSWVIGKLWDIFQ